MRAVQLLLSLSPLCLPLLGLPLPAQTVAAFAAPIVEISTVGPAGWRQRFAPTNLGSLLESAGGKQLWHPLVDRLDAAWLQWLGGDDAAFSAARKRLLDFGGRVRLLLWSEPGAARGRDMIGGLVIEGDGRIDLDALPRELAPLVAAGQGQVGAAVRDGERVLVPVQARGDFAAALQRLRALAAAAPLRPDAPALRCTIDVPAAMQALDPAADDTKAMLAAGFGALRRFEVQIGTAGPHLQLETSVTFGDGDRGIFGGLFPTQTGRPALLASVPAGAPNWRAGQLDLAQFYVALERAVGIYAGKTAAELRQSIVKETGVDPVTDVFAHAHTDALLIAQLGSGNPFEFVMFGTGGEIERPEGAADDPWAQGVLFALRLKDEAAFRAGLAGLLKGVWPSGVAATTAHDGVDIQLYRGPFAGDLELAVGRGLFVFSMGAGDNGTRQIAAVLDAAKAAAAEGKPADAKPADGKLPASELPAAFADLHRHAPAGLNGLASTDLATTLHSTVSMLFQMLQEALPKELRILPERLDGEATAAAAALLREHHLDRVRTLTGNDGVTWRWRIFW